MESLPAPSLVTLRKGMPAMGIDSWSDIGAWLLSQYGVREEDKRNLFQAEVADESPDLKVGRFLAIWSSMPEFIF